MPQTPAIEELNDMTDSSKALEFQDLILLLVISDCNGTSPRLKLCQGLEMPTKS